MVLQPEIDSSAWIISEIKAAGNGEDFGSIRWVKLATKELSVLNIPQSLS
jgi:hypothetical protein